MADLTAADRRKLEKLLGMASGHGLNFGDRTAISSRLDEHRRREVAGLLHQQAQRLSGVLRSSLAGA